jgi:hypothetical protein
MTTIKLPLHTTFREILAPGIGVFALILCAAIGAKIGRVVFGASEDAWTSAYQFGMVLGVVFFSIANGKTMAENYFSRQYPSWVFLSTIVSSFLLCELFKVL